LAFFIWYRFDSWVSENDITDVLDQTFSLEDERFGEIITVDLKENGRDIPVTEENKREYIEYVITALVN
jgi:E3 ubiquitin-protein ligase NEDD4